MEFPEQLKTHRQRAGLSQEDLAQRIYVSRQTISNWEMGKTYPDIHSLLLSNLFDASVDELLKGDVVSMESKLREDSRILGRLSWAMLGFTIAALASGGIAIIVRDVGPMAEEGVRFGLSGYRKQDWMSNVPLHAMSNVELWGYVPD